MNLSAQQWWHEGDAVQKPHYPLEKQLCLFPLELTRDLTSSGMKSRGKTPAIFQKQNGQGLEIFWMGELEIFWMGELREKAE